MPVDDHDKPTLEKGTVDLPAPATAAVTASSPHESPGGRIGPYRLVQLIGEGGFGSVYLAEQERPVQRRVALKIIKLGMDTRQVVARFEQERQALAMMEHPSIARVLDAGITDSGRPYFVMDLVKGDPIGEYCDKNNLPIDQRLALFSQVCAAVQHAHSKGIIHRDLKPSNVLVSAQDLRPLARVIDFGIAKATSARLTDKTLVTEQRQLIGTPEYMSPEQAEGSLDIDTRSDVYSLGVLLYELLTGSTPFPSEVLRSATYAEIQRTIREKEPPRPSTRLSQATLDASTVAAHRQSDPRRLVAALRGELDWIVMKAIEKDRSRRYQTASELALDIERFLTSQPVIAAPPSTVYRMSKFIRRNRGVVAAAAIVGVALVLGVVGTSVGLIEARRERRAALASAERAAEEAARATRAEAQAQSRLAESEATVAFLDEMLGAVDPAAQGKDVTMRRVLDSSARSVGARFADRPAVAARLHGTIGRTYMGLGVYDQGEPHLREQLRLRTAQLGPEHPDTCRATNELGEMLTRAGEYDQAERLLKTAVADHQRLFGRAHPITVQAIDRLALLHVEQGRAADAEPLLREVLALRASSADPAEQRDLIATMNALAILLADTEQFDESERLFEDTLARQTRTDGADHPFTLEVRGNYAWMLYWSAMSAQASDPPKRQRQLERARQMGEAVLVDKKRIVGEEHSATLTAMNNLALVYQQLDMIPQAEALKRQDLEITLRTLGEDHPQASVSLANLGGFLRGRGKCDEAIPYLERSIRTARKVFHPDHQGLAFTLGWYGSCLARLNRFAEAEPAALEAVGIITRTMGAQHPVALAMSRDLSTLYRGWDVAEPGKGHDTKAAEWEARAAAGAKDSESSADPAGQ